MVTATRLDTRVKGKQLQQERRVHPTEQSKTLDFDRYAIAPLDAPRKIRSGIYCLGTPKPAPARILAPATNLVAYSMSIMATQPVWTLDRPAAMTMWMKTSRGARLVVHNA